MPGPAAQQSTNSNQTQNTSAVTNPWAPAIPQLTNLISQVGSLPTSVTPAQQQAGANLASEAGAIPNFGPMGTNIVGNLASSSTNPQQGMVVGSYGNLVNQMKPYTDPNYLNPLTNPNMQPLLDQISKDATKNIEGQFAAAGRDPMDNAAADKTIAKAVAAGEAPVLMGQYNTNVQQAQTAEEAMQQAGASTANEWASLSQLPLQNQIAALSAAGEIPGLMTAPGAYQFNAANMNYGLPFQNLTNLEQMLLPFGALGGQTTGTGTSTGTSTTTQQQNPLTSILGGSLGLLGLLNMSDIRLKEDVEPIGLLHSGLPFYKFRYLTDPDNSIRFGVMAQDVEQVMPEAVYDVGGFKAVDYGAVLENGG